MKKYIVLLLFTSIYSYSSIAQTTTCNDKLIMSIIGTWKLSPQQQVLKPVIKTEYDQATKNMETFHKLLLEAYPQGIGCEPVWNKIGIYPGFYVPWVYSYHYYTAILPYFCINNKPVKIDRTNTTFRVYVNTYDVFWTSTRFFINGQEVFYRQPKISKWKGIDAYHTEEEPLVMLTRKDMLPYKPVTRKQYLDYMIHYFDSLYTDMANQFKKVDDPSMKEQAATISTTRDNILNVYRKEIKKSGTNDLLDSAAVVKSIGNISFSEDTDIFITEDKGGRALFMVNTAYFRKDIPKYIPQFMVVRIQGGWGSPSETYFSKTMKEKFPFEKLQAMIDK